MTTDDTVHRALVAALRDRVDIATAYAGLDTPPALLERLRVLAFGAASADGRDLDDVRTLHQRAGRLLEDLAHHEIPQAGVLQ